MIEMAKFRTVRVQIANNFRINFFSRGNPHSLYLISENSIDILVILAVWRLGHLSGVAFPFIQEVGVTNFIFNNAVDKV